MKPAPGVWGLDLGQCALKALRLQEIDGQLHTTAFDYVEYPKILSQPDADPDQLTREALEQFLSRNSLRGDIVAIAVPGQSGLARFVKLPPVEEKKIADIVKFEAKQQIPFNLDEVVWDYQKIGSGNVVDGFALETEIGLFAMKRDMVNRYLGHFKEVGVEVHVIQMAPLALCNFVAYDLLNKEPGAPVAEGKPSCVVGLDIGTDSSNLVITDGGKIIWQRPIPLGGNHFTRALTKEMKLTFAKAEHLKRNATKSGAAELKKILGSLKPVLNDFVGEVQRSLGYFTNTHRDATIEYMVGLGNAFRLPGLQRFLAEKLQLDVRKLEKMQRIEGDTVITSPVYQENLLSFGVAYGLALQGLKRAKLITNLLPGEIRMERLVRAKKPWAVAAAGVLTLGLGAAALGNYLNERPYTADNVKKAVKRANDAKSSTDAMAAAFEKAKRDALAEEEAVKAIIAGQFERLNWMRLARFVSDTVPRPDGSNLSDKAKATYFDNTPKPPRPGVVVVSGKQAWQDYQARLKAGATRAASGDDKEDTTASGIDDLVQYQIESIDCRYCDDLTAFWTAAIKGKEQADVRPNENFGKKPEGKAWVVEIAGFTYHRDQDAFIRQTLLDNIARLGMPAPATPVPPAPGKDPQPGVQPTPAPVTPTPAPATPGAADPKAEGSDATKEPVLNRVSHVLLYRYSPKPSTETAFEMASGGELEKLLGGTSGGAAGGGGGEPAMGPASMMPSGGAAGGGTAGGAVGENKPSRSGWKPLSGRGGGGTGMTMPGMPGGSPGMPGGSSPGLAPPTGPMSTGGGPVASGPKTTGGGAGGGGAGPRVNQDINGHVRTEFVILFIWREPTPSDALRGGLDAGTPATK